MPPFTLTSPYKAIYFFLFALIAASLSGVSNRASAAEDIPGKFDTYWSGAPDAYEKFRSCLPSTSEATFKSGVLNIADKTISKIGSSNPLNKTNYVLVQNDTFVCIKLNARKKPVIPLSFFYGTISFESQSSEEQKALYKDLAQQLAQHGFAQALIAMDNGNAIYISYMNESADPIRVYYNTSFLKKGEYNEQDFKPVYRIKASGMSFTTYDDRGNSKSLTQGVLAPRPKKDDFLVVSGTWQTGQFPFLNTKWELKSMGSVLFKDGGKLTYSSNNGSSIEGDWKVENNALYFHYGLVYFSSTLNTQGDELLSEGRSIMPASPSMPREMEELESKERRWKATWLRSAQ